MTILRIESTVDIHRKDADKKKHVDQSPHEGKTVAK